MGPSPKFHETRDILQTTTGAGGVDQLRSEPLDPSVQGHVVDLDATLGQQILQVPVRQPEPKVPTDRQQDHLCREPEAREPRGRYLDWTTATTKSHTASVPTGRWL